VEGVALAASGGKFVPALYVAAEASFTAVSEKDIPHLWLSVGNAAIEMKI
jgi:hypothetical protein